jgi:Rps23 Pro-64 3,4-dihydroxylase Tpa1-like proline 4-hydroxylase
MQPRFHDTTEHLQDVGTLDTIAKSSAVFHGSQTPQLLEDMKAHLALTDKNTDSERPLYMILDASTLDPNTLYKAVLQQRSYFNNSPVLGADYRPVVDDSHRKSLTLFNRKLVKSLSETLIKVVATSHLEILEYLKIKPFKVARTQVDCVTYQDGDHFEQHTDFVPLAIFPRRYTWVYYYHKEPRRFSGGQLVFFKQGRPIEEVSPKAGTLIAFATDISHAVKTVRVPSGEFADSRFTMTGFVCERTSVPYRLFSKSVRTLKRLF